MCTGSAGTIPAEIMLIAIALVDVGEVALPLLARYSAEFEANGGGSGTVGRGWAKPPIPHGRDGYAIENAGGACADDGHAGYGSRGSHGVPDHDITFDA